jgi:hypothetical protein
MNKPQKRIEQVRLIVVVLVDLTHPEFIETLAASGGKPVAEVVSSEVVSNLESVSYVESVFTSPL